MPSRFTPVLIIFCCFIFVISSVWVLDQWVVEPAFENLENSQALEDSLRVYETLQRELSAQAQALSGWALWDDAYDYVQTRNKAFIESNFSNWPVLESSMGLNLCYIVDTEGQIVFSQIYDSDLGGYITADVLSDEPGGFDRVIQSIAGNPQPYEGFIAAGNNLILLAGHPILTSQGTGSSRGMMFFGKFCDLSILNSTRKQTHVPFDVFLQSNSALNESEKSLFSSLKAGETRVQPAADKRQHVYRMLFDPFNQPVALLKVPVRADISHAGKSTSRSVGILVILIAVFLISAGAVVSNRWRLSKDESVDLVAIGIATLILLAGLSVTFFVHLEMKDIYQEEVEASFRAAAENRINGIHSHLQNILHEMDAVRRFFEGVDSVDREAFRRFVSPIRERFHFKSIEWISKVIHDQRLEFEKKAQNDGLSSFRISERTPQGHLIPAGERSVYFPISFFEPQASSKEQIGFDIASDPIQLQACSDAELTRMPAATPIVAIQQNGRELSGFRIFVPVYQSSAAGVPDSGTSRVFVGCVGGVFLTADIMNHAIEQTSPQGLLTQILDLSAPPESRLLHDHTPRMGQKDSGIDPDLVYAREMRFAGRIWRTEVRPNGYFIAASGTASYRLVPYVGLLISILLALYLYSLITQHRRAENLIKTRTAELLRSEERWQFALEGAGDGVWDWNPLTDELFFSPQCEAMLGYGENEFASHPNEWTSHVHPEDLDRTLQELDLHIENAAPLFHSEFRMRCRDGSYKWILARGKILSRDEKGRPLRMIGTLTDVTRIRQFEKELSETKTILQEAFQQSPIPMVMLSADGIVRIINEAALLFLGIEDEPSPIGQSISSYQPSWKYFDPQGVPLKVSELPVFQALKGNSMKNRELGVQTKSGDTRWNLATAGPIYDEKGTLLAAFSVFPEITERKISEQELRHAKDFLQAIYDQVNDAIFIHDGRTGKIIDVNRKMCEMYECTREEALTLNPEVFCTGERPYSSQDAMEWLIKARLEGPQTVEWLGRKKSGKLFWVEVSINYVFIGQEECFLVTVKDITERKHSEEEKSRLEGQLRQAQKIEAVGLLAGGVAHDLNNLLTPILGYGEMLLSDPRLDEAAGKDIELMVEAGKRARDLVRQLMAYGRRQTLEIKALDLNKVVMAFGSLLRRTLREDIQIDMSLAASLPTVNADQGQIEQVLMNLGINAQDAMPDGGRLVIETSPLRVDKTFQANHAEVAPGDYVQLSVKDSGHGIDPATQSRIFEPFFTTKELGKGTGLGLATVYGIVRQHGGYIWLESEMGTGSTFRICLPAAAAEEVDPVPASVVAAHPRGNETILVAEDEPIVREIACEMLKGLGYRILTAETSEECLKIAQDPGTRIDLLLTDVIMPEMTGKDLYQRILVASPLIKVLFMSGYTASIIADRGVIGEDLHFIQKPFTRATLAHKVREALDS